MDEDKFKKFLRELRLKLNALVKSINDNEDRIETLELKVAKLERESR